MDDADIVAERQEREIDFALLSLRATAKRRAAAMDAGRMCMICASEIPEARRRVLPGCCTCVGCQETLEQAMGR